MKWFKSLIYTVTLESISPNPNSSKNCIAKIIGKNRIYLHIPNPLKSIKAIIIIHEIKKFILSLVTTDKGKISLGK